MTTPTDSRKDGGAAFPFPGAMIFGHTSNVKESTRAMWAESTEGVISDAALECRKNGESYVMHCVIATRGEAFLVADKESDPLAFFGLDGYLIAPLERALLLPERPNLLQRIAIRILGRSPSNAAISDKLAARSQP